MSTFRALRGILVVTFVAAGLASVAAGAAMAASVTECIPAKYAMAVIAGNAAGECKASKTTTYTPVALPVSAEEQQTLLAILPYIKYEPAGVGGKPTIQVSGANLQILSGAGSETTLNGAGNLIVGYDVKSILATGSNNLVVGSEPQYSSYGSLIAGQDNTAAGPFTALFGFKNTTLAMDSSVSGGVANEAEGADASVAGGEENKAKGNYSSILGGYRNTTSGPWAADLGGNEVLVSKEKGEGY